LAELEAAWAEGSDLSRGGRKGREEKIGDAGTDLLKFRFLA
jgi:hypothetical protein